MAAPLRSAASPARWSFFLGFALPSWNQPLLSSGVYKPTSELGKSDLETWLAAGRLLYYREGATATVSVREALGTRSLSIDGKVDASNMADMLTQRLLAHVPLLLHPEPHRVAIVGLGSGVTLGAALKHPVSATLMSSRFRPKWSRLRAFSNRRIIERSPIPARASSLATVACI